MKKILSTTILMLIITISIKAQTTGMKAQNSFYDALFLKRYISNNKLSYSNYTTPREKEMNDSLSLTSLSNGQHTAIVKRLAAIKLLKKDSIFSLLIKYKLISASDTTNATNINNSLHANPFFSSVDAAGLTKSHEGSLSLGVNFNSITYSIGGLDVTNIANGIAGLLIDRAKQELSVAFFERFKTYVKDPSHPEFVTLFPKTTDKLDSLLSYNYPQMLPVLRTAFFADLKQITFHLQQIFALPKYQAFIAKFPEVLIVIKSIQIVRNLEDGTSNAADVINDLATDASLKWDDDSMNVWYRNMGSFIKLGNIISQSLRQDQSDFSSIWISSKQMKNLATDNIFTTIYLGLIYQQIKNENNGQSLKLYNIDAKTKKTVVSADLAVVLGNQKSSLLLFQTKLSEFISLADEVNKAIASNNKKKAEGKALTDSDYYNYINTSLDAIDYVFNIVEVFDPKFNSNNILVIPRKANSLYKDIYSKEYTQAISDGFDIVNQVRKIVDSTDNDLAKLLKAISEIKPYAVFMANVAEAKTPADVEAALNNAILPVGSYTIKQNSSCNISLNGYIGYGFDFNAGNLYAKGIYAPIGFSFTHTFKKLPVTIFFSIIDVGSIVSYQLSNPSSTTTGTSTSSLSQQIKLSSIFSPSAHLFVEIPKTPIAFGVGWRRTPTLYYSSGPNYATVPSRSVFNATALIDIPFFTFHNKPLK